MVIQSLRMNFHKHFPRFIQVSLMMDYQVLKKEIAAHCIQVVLEKLEALKRELILVQESANNDTKSSMGDKYETGREIVMQERNKLGAQLDLFANQLTALKVIDIDNEHSVVKYGSLVETSQGWFYISVPIGKISIGDKQIFVISLNAPLAKEMIGKKVGDSFSLNNQSYLFKQVL